MADYNGWTNYETWCVNFWLTSEPGPEEELRNIACTGDSTNTRAKSLESWVTRAYMDAQITGQFANLLYRALENVNWREIVEHHEYDR